MKDKIKSLCKDIEKEYNIKIIFCVESGSRSWRMDSKDSDYDVRFVYTRPLDDYLQINLPKDVIMKHYDKQGNPHSAEGCFIDVCGFDIFKFTRMLSSSNPTVIEWLQSDIIYCGDKPKVFVDFAKNNFNKVSLYHHYKSMCRQNYLKYLKFGNLVTYKKYLYAMRGLVNAKYVSVSGILPPISFVHTLNASSSFISQNIIFKLKEIIELKKESREKKVIQNEVKIDNYIESFLKDNSDCPEYKSKATLTDLNKELRRLVK